MFEYLTKGKHGISLMNQVRNIKAIQYGSKLTLMLLMENCGENIDGLEVKIYCRIKEKEQTTITLWKLWMQRPQDFS